jgi:hypothetical protein
MLDGAWILFFCKSKWVTESVRVSRDDGGHTGRLGRFQNHNLRATAYAADLSRSADGVLGIPPSSRTSHDPSTPEAIHITAFRTSGLAHRSSEL